MSAPFLYEFLYRGRPESGPGSGAPGWHVVVGQYVAMPGQPEPQFVASGALTPAQAAAAGFPLAVVAEAINAAALVDRDAQAAALAAMTAERDRLAAQLAESGPRAGTGAVISARQFYQALDLAGDITRAEALAAVENGILPAKIRAALDALPDEDRYVARMLISGATTFQRSHPMVAMLGAILDKDAATLDALWASAALL